MLIVMLNFLIAVISQVYEEDLDAASETNYLQKSMMNLESEHLMFFLCLRERRQFFILTGAIKDNFEQNEEWHGLIQKIKSNHKIETSKIEDKIKALEQRIDEKMDKKF